MEARQLLATFVVNTTADAGTGSLRQAIIAANALADADDIVFQIPSPIPGAQPQQTIVLLSPLPTIINPVAIRGYSQVGAVINDPQIADALETDLAVLTVRLDGSNAGAGANGLTIAGPNSDISGLSITGFAGAGIAIEGVAAVGNTVHGNFIGITSFDPLRGPNPVFPNGQGIRVSGPNNRIGGTFASERNVIQGNRDAGVLLQGAAGTGNLVEGNFILDNAGDGVRITTSNNFVGEAIGPGPGGGGNVISGNLRGVLIQGIPAQGNILLNNEIGTDVGIFGASPPVRGLTPRPNTLEGVLILDAPNNVVGGLIANSRNVIAANGTDGVSIQGSLATGNRVLGNYVGINIRNNVIALGLSNRDGLNIASANNTVGGTTAEARNVIANNARHGVTITGPAATGNRVQGNYIGTVNGGEDVGNTFQGVLIDNATDNVIGGTETGARNVISGNNNGVLILGPGASGNRVQGNFIGTAADGVTDLGNAVDGVRIDGAPRNTIGGTAAGRATSSRATTAACSSPAPGRRATSCRATASAPTLRRPAPGQLARRRADLGRRLEQHHRRGRADAPQHHRLQRLQRRAGRVRHRQRDPVQPDLREHPPGHRPGRRRGDAQRPVRWRLRAQQLAERPGPDGRHHRRRNDRPGHALQHAQHDLHDPVLPQHADRPVRLRRGPDAVRHDHGDDRRRGNAALNLTLADGDPPGAIPHGDGDLARRRHVGVLQRGHRDAGPDPVRRLRVHRRRGRGPGHDHRHPHRGPRRRRLGPLLRRQRHRDAGADFIPTTGTLTFDPGEVNPTFIIPILQDVLVEGGETVSLTLGTPTNSAMLGTPGAATLTIQDDDRPAFSSASPGSPSPRAPAGPRSPSPGPTPSARRRSPSPPAAAPRRPAPTSPRRPGR
jgi:hypothetical protein